MDFQLNQRLAKGGFELSQHGICKVLLKSNATFPWIVIIPEVDSRFKDLHQLENSDYLSVSATIKAVARFIEEHFKAEKVNIGAIGNIVPQLHIHAIGRFQSDPEWPNPVWGTSHKTEYTEDEVQIIRATFSDWLIANG